MFSKDPQKTPEQLKDPMDNNNNNNTIVDSEKYDSQSDDERLGKVSDIQNASQTPAIATPTSKKLNTTQAVIIFVTNEVGLGMLSLPSALNTLGFFPGVLLLVVMGLLSLYSAYNLIQFWRKYPWMLNIVDYGRQLGGPWVEAVFAIAFFLNMALISAGALVTLTIGLNIVSDHATCTVAFTVVSALAMWAICVPRSMRFVSWASWPCTISILACVFIVMIALGVQGPRDPTAPLNLKAIGNPTFTEAVAAFLNIGFAYAGNAAFPTVLVEMENPSRDFARAVTIEKCVSMTIYVTVSCTIYALAGEQVASPAIGSVQPTMAKVTYAVSFIGLLGTGLVFGMSAARYLHVVFMRTHVERRNKAAPGKVMDWVAWVACVTIFWLFVWTISNAIPVFNSILNISASLLMSWLTWGVSSLFWFKLNWNGRWRSTKAKLALTAFNVLILSIVMFMTVPGMYASIASLLAVFADPNQTINGPFTCANNA